MIGRLLALAAGLVLLLAGPAFAHEVRPAMLRIVETGPGDYQVDFKRPVVGDMALRLVPHLSGGVLERTPDAEQAAPGFVTRVWRVRGGPPLDGQTVTIEGLSQSVTDVLVMVTTRQGKTVDLVLHPASPTAKLDLSGPKGLATPAYLRLGVEHILTGWDHLLFVLGLLLLIGWNWRLLKAITAFTVAHSITLALAALGFVHFPSAAIEALVALSILFLAVQLAGAGPPDALARRRPWIIAFSFGLLHGLAFAGALAAVGLPAKAEPQALLLFNVGVEIGQLLFVSAVLALAAAGRAALSRLPNWRTPAWAPLAPAYLIGGLSAYWLIERTLVAMSAPA
jgi:hydrogenase/urease accessory protein HupE